jgi:hypothetical protein
MQSAQPNFFDSFSADEADLMKVILKDVADMPWAQPIIHAINESGGLTGANKARFFELRFGYTLHRAGITPQYEIPGEGESTLDFGFASATQRWAVELMRLEETQAARQATHAHVDDDGIPWINRVLSTNAEDARQSTEGETIKAVERICQKCELNGRPHKFVAPKAFSMRSSDQAGIGDRGGAARDGHSPAVDKNIPGRVAAGRNRVVDIVAERRQHADDRIKAAGDSHCLSFRASVPAHAR